MALLDTAQMALADQGTIALGVSGSTLMRRAGTAVADAICLRWRPCPITLLCGPGNNGGDAWVAAAALKKAGQSVTVLAPHEQKNTDPVAKSAMTAYRKAKGPVVTTFPEDEKFDLIIDGLFGIGLRVCVFHTDT